MSQYFKAQIINDDEYPMPETPRAPQGQGEGSGMQADDRAVTDAASDLERLVELVRSMRPEIDALQESARRQGAETGYREGIAQARNELATLIQEATVALAAAQAERERMTRLHGDALGRLAMNIARKVIGRALSLDDKAIATIVEDTIRELEPSASLEIRVHPDEVAVLERERHRLDNLVTGGGTITIVADDSITHGGCMLSSPVGDVDARIETRLAILEQAFGLTSDEAGA